MWKFFVAGGPVMWPLALCSIIALAVIMERSIFWLRAHTRSDARNARQLLNEVEDKGIEATIKATAVEARAGIIFTVLKAGLDSRALPIEKTLETAAIQQMRRMRRGMSVLNTIIAVAPMLGILGTVLGIIQSFDMLGHSGVGDPRLVIGGLAEALITTAAGLIIAVPALCCYNYFNARIEAETDLIEIYASYLEAILKNRSISKEE